VIDGDLNKDPWTSAPWSEPFLEIRGADAPPTTQPRTGQKTRVKMAWDEDFLYVAAMMHYEVGDEIVAKCAVRHSSMSHTDSNFGVFVDPGGFCHGYKEFAINALNTVWDLLLSRPFSDGGGNALNGEVGPWNGRSCRTATRVLKGSLHDASRPSSWCCEIALAHTDTLAHLPCPVPMPAVGSSWRINFSRVEEEGDVKWAWSPQVVWSPAAQRYVGQSNMHLPDAYGYVVFADESGNLTGGLPASCWQDPQQRVRLAAASLYYSAKTLKHETGEDPTSLEELLAAKLVDTTSIKGLRISVGNSKGFAFKVTDPAWTAVINSERLLKVKAMDSSAQLVLLQGQFRESQSEAQKLKQQVDDLTLELLNLRGKPTQNVVAASFHQWCLEEEDFSAFRSTDHLDGPAFQLGPYKDIKLRFWPYWDVVKQQCSVKVIAPLGTEMMFKLYVNNDCQRGQLKPGVEYSAFNCFFEAPDLATTSLWLELD